MPRGGLQNPPGGRPKGTTGIKHQSTLSKEEGRALVREMVMAQLQPLIDAQVAHAKGLQYLVIRDEATGKFKKISKDKMDEMLESGSSDLERLEVWEKEPSVAAFTDLMNRTLDKPKEQPQELKVTGELELVATRLLTARKRLKKP